VRKKKAEMDPADKALFACVKVLCCCFNEQGSLLSGRSSSLVSTTNGIERQHETLKYSFLADQTGGSMLDLVSPSAHSSENY